MQRDEQGRPFLDAELSRITAALAAALPALGHVDAARVLYVAGAARLESRASIRPLSFGAAAEREAHADWHKPLIEIRGVPMLYEICLRPRFFLEATAEERLTILVHELWHASPRFDGTLAEERRHARAGLEVEAEVRAMAAELLPRAELREHRRLLEHRGELRLAAWRVRPPTRIPAASRLRRRYDERDLYPAVVLQR